MPSSTVCTFTDPDAYHAALRAQRVEGVVTARGNFHAELTLIDFDRPLMQRAEENLPRVLNYETGPDRAAIIFATDQDQPAIHVSGVVLASGYIIAWNSKRRAHHWSAAACRWGSMSLTHEDLAATGRAIIGRELTAPSWAHRIRPLPAVLEGLSNPHEAAGRLAKTAPDILAHTEVARALEQALVQAMVLCIGGGVTTESSRAHHRHAEIMRRLEAVLEANPDRTLYAAELCAATGASDRTLRACCQEHLGMSPMRYLWLRRMHLARRGLRVANPAATTVTEIATSYGFWELGRFSVAYRSLFGESPSAALRRPAEDPRPQKNIGSPWQLPESA
jgi:AraC-like DNA-binding protein